MISRKFQFGVCNYYKPCASAHTVREGKLYHKGEKEVGMVKANKESMTFFWLSCCQEKWGAFLLLAGLCYHHRARGHSHLLALEIYLIEISNDWLFTFPATMYKSFKFSSQSFAACVHAQLCLTLCDPMDYSPPGSSGHGIFQARIMEWVAIFSSGNLPDPGIKLASLMSPALAGMFFTPESPRKPLICSKTP